MKKIFSFFMSIMLVLLLASCQQSVSEKDSVSSIYIVLPRAVTFARQADEPEVSTVEMNFLLTVSSAASSENEITAEGKSGEVLKVEVEAGEYNVLLQAFALDDSKKAQPLFEGKAEKVSVKAGESTKVSIQMNKVDNGGNEPEDKEGVDIMLILPGVEVSGSLSVTAFIGETALKNGEIVYGNKQINLVLLNPVGVEFTEVVWYSKEINMDDETSVELSGNNAKLLEIEVKGPVTVYVLAGDSNGKKYFGSVSFVAADQVVVEESN